jgi:hypothetical protein
LKENSFGGYMSSASETGQDVHDVLISERNQQYANAWRKTGLWVAKNAEFLRSKGDISFCIIMLHNKLARAEGSPRNPDHYDDVIGYAKLILSSGSVNITPSERLEYLDIIETARKILEHIRGRW